jgi:ATP-binding cassette subfamily C protein LapB
MVLDGDLTVGGLGACTMLTGRCIQPLLGGVAMWSRYQALADSRVRVGELAAIRPEDRPDLPNLEVTEGRITLEGIRFGEMAGGGWLFDGLDLDVHPGQIIGIDSPNGSGRSSLLKLIAGEETPADGEIRIDGQDVTRHNVVPARPLVALVPADPGLVRGSFLQNLTLYQPEREDEALRLAQILGLDAIASALAEGWHTQIGVGAVPMAQGVVQRIGLVRALVQRPRILLLDDITARLDSRGDACLARLLVGLRGQCTVLLVSHRRSVLAVTDRVLEVHDGQLRPVA